MSFGSLGSWWLRAVQALVERLEVINEALKADPMDGIAAGVTGPEPALMPAVGMGHREAAGRRGWRNHRSRICRPACRENIKCLSAMYAGLRDFRDMRSFH